MDLQEEEEKGKRQQEEDVLTEQEEEKLMQQLVQLTSSSNSSVVHQLQCLSQLDTLEQQFQHQTFSLELLFSFQMSKMQLAKCCKKWNLVIETAEEAIFIWKTKTKLPFWSPLMEMLHRQLAFALEKMEGKQHSEKALQMKFKADEIASNCGFSNIVQ